MRCQMPAAHVHLLKPQGTRVKLNGTSAASGAFPRAARARAQAMCLSRETEMRVVVVRQTLVLVDVVLCPRQIFFRAARRHI